MIDYAVILKAIAAMAAVMFGLRVLPLIFCKKPIKNRFIQSFLFYIPYAVLTSMAIPEAFFCTASIPSAIAGIVIACVLAYFEKDLLMVCLSATVAVFITDQVMRFVK
ncbi:MAG: AzlD domain-containing protein [Oscillospiraceae bacterium]|jgi:branched-subunit amino acid transport protein|nr:AzlD domain-containing protein [Oscillospiraceae bacterium]